jgi:hypothetical protein
MNPEVLLTRIFFAVPIVYPDHVPSFKLFALYCEGENSTKLTWTIEEIFKGA